MNIWNWTQLKKKYLFWILWLQIYSFKNTASSFQDEEEIRNIKFNI